MAAKVADRQAQVFWQSLRTEAEASLSMVVTMTGLQEARARAPRNPTALLGLMTAASAIGQLAGPLLSRIVDFLPVGHRTALGYALQPAAAALGSKCRLPVVPITLQRVIASLSREPSDK
jgi:hypothetical protein